jgi:hypothetical protein
MSSSNNVGPRSTRGKQKELWGKTGRMYGLYGKDVIKSSGELETRSTPAGIYYDAIYFIKDTILNSITDDELISGELVGINFPAGTVLHGRMKDIEIFGEDNDGAAIAYRSHYQE